MRKLRRQRKKLGLCRCGRRPVQGRGLCKRHLEIGHKAYWKNPKEYSKKARVYLTGLKTQVLSAYGDKCKCCGVAGSEFLTIDHVYNDGKQHRLEIGSQTSNLYRWLIKNNFPKRRFQILCWNCNVAKKNNGGVCPHKKGMVKI